MDCKEFVQLVREMRKAQRARVSTGQPSDFERARLLEKQVDAASVIYDDVVDQSPNLFK